MKIARSFNCGLDAINPQAPEGRLDFTQRLCQPPLRGLILSDGVGPQLKLQAILGCPCGTKHAASDRS